MAHPRYYPFTHTRAPAVVLKQQPRLVSSSPQLLKDLEHDNFLSGSEGGLSKMRSFISGIDNLDLLSSSSVLKVLLSAFGGIILPLLDNTLSSSTKTSLVTVLSFILPLLDNSLSSSTELSLIIVPFVFQGSWILWASLFPVNSSTSLFYFLGVWHALLSFPPIVRHILGVETDDQFL